MICFNKKTTLANKKFFQNYAEDQFVTKVAHNTQESCKLIEVGSEYVTENAVIAMNLPQKKMTAKKIGVFIKS